MCDRRTKQRAAVAHTRSLKPLDAIHLATAQQMQVAEFHTTDDRLKNWNDLGFAVRESWTAQPKLI